MEDLNLKSTGLGINPLNYDNVACPVCGSIVYNEGIVFKNIPGLEAGNGTEDVAFPIPVVYCANCGALLPEYKEKLVKTKDEKKTSLIV